MRFSIIAIATPLLLAGSAIAGYNCKCQDSRGQFDDATSGCCSDQDNIDTKYHADQSHQCSNFWGALNSGDFVECCQKRGVKDAYCWK